MVFAHDVIIHPRRVEVLQRHFAPLLPSEATVLDVGCGDGLLSKRLAEGKPGISVAGIDVVVRPDTHIPVGEFDGAYIPFEDSSIDVVMFVDVFHHTQDPLVLLREAARVARKSILIKDHTRSGILAYTTLRFMDWVGNSSHGVALPYNYWTKDAWDKAFHGLDLSVTEWISELRLYPVPWDYIFGRSLHFITQLSLPPKRQ